MNGERAQPGEIPYQAAIYQHDPQQGVYGPCGGTLINPLWVVTAGHCFPWPNARTEVRLGGINVDQMSYREFANYRIIHEQYSANPYYNDIALLRLPYAPSGPGIAVIRYASTEWLAPPSKFPDMDKRRQTVRPRRICSGPACK